MVRRASSTIPKPIAGVVRVAGVLVGVACLAGIAGCRLRSSSAQIHSSAQVVRPYGTVGYQPSHLTAGFGTRTEGGLAGRVLRVTRLDADGPGSLRHALEASGPRLVVFEVGGVIDLGGRSLVVKEPRLTIAGQTAPDPGITLVRGGLGVETHDVVIQHLAVRPGDAGPPPWDPDALGARRGPEGPVFSVVFDHCSATWAVDENLSISGPADVATADGPEATAHDVTLNRCLIAEGLSHATHPKGEHSKGTLLHDGVRRVSILGSLYAHNRERNPRLKGGTRAVLVNNLIYNWGSSAVGMGAWGNTRRLAGAEAAVAGNLALAGPDTKRRELVRGLDPGAAAWLRDNLVLDRDGTPMPAAGSTVRLLAEPPLWPGGLEAAPAWEAGEQVLRCAGARAGRRDAIDARIVRSVIMGEGHIIDSQEQVGGYPRRQPTRRPIEVPEGREQRRIWLHRLAAAIDCDAHLDLSPLERRLGRTGSPR